MAVSHKLTVLFKVYETRKKKTNKIRQVNRNHHPGKVYEEEQPESK